ncbi:MAG: hypothetical protein ACRD0P_15510 [Stackebrandtia sp.]
MAQDGEWYVLIFEERGLRDVRRRELVETVKVGPDLAEARAKAEAQAGTWEPEHPMMPSRRMVFRTSADSWVVDITGATTAYYFEVRLAQLVADEAVTDDSHRRAFDEVDWR